MTAIRGCRAFSMFGKSPRVKSSGPNVLTAKVFWRVPRVTMSNASNSCGYTIPAMFRRRSIGSPPATCWGFVAFSDPLMSSPTAGCPLHHLVRPNASSLNAWACPSASCRRPCHISSTFALWICSRSQSTSSSCVRSLQAPRHRRLCALPRPSFVAGSARDLLVHTGIRNS
jgi:hypothetical protein